MSIMEIKRLYLIISYLVYEICCIIHLKCECFEGWAFVKSKKSIPGKFGNGLTTYHHPNHN